MREKLIPFFNPLPFRPIQNLARVNPLVINYHVVSDKSIPHIINLYNYRSVSAFIEDLDFLIRNFHPIGLTEFLNYVQHKTSLPERSFMLTFDDGFSEIYDIIAPILLNKNLTATFFLTSNFIDNKELGYDHKKSLLIDHLLKPENSKAYDHVKFFLGAEDKDMASLKKIISSISYPDRFIVDKIASEIEFDFDSYLNKTKPYLTSAQIQSLLKQGFTFGAHSIDHARFSEIELDEQLNQAISSIQQISDQFSIPYKVFAFPYSDNKVSADFFNRMSSQAEATFGTNGLLQDTAMNNFQRISVEKYNLSARSVLKFHFFRKYIYRKLGKDVILRTKYQKP